MKIKSVIIVMSVLLNVALLGAVVYFDRPVSGELGAPAPMIHRLPRVASSQSASHEIAAVSTAK